MSGWDWTTGEWRDGAPDGSGVPWSLVVAGDWAPMDDHIRALSEKPSDFYAGLLPVIQEADLSLVNVECVLGDKGTPIVKDGLLMRAPATTVAGLAAVPFKLACLANNHSMDYGRAGLVQTLQLLHESGIPTVGAGPEEKDRLPFCATIKGVRLAIINVAEGEEGRARDGGPGVAGLSPDRIKEQIASLRQQVDVVIVVAHAGREYVPVPPPYLYRFYRDLVDAGADLVVGHHPHVPQGIEIYRDRPIAYSLGNFAFWIPGGSPYLRLGYLFKAEFRGAQLRSARIVPYQIKPDRLHALSGEECRAFMDALKTASAVLTTSAQVEAMWGVYADHWFRATCSSEVATFAALLADERTLANALLARLTSSRAPRVADKVLRRLFRLLLNRLVSHSGDESVSVITDQSRRGAAILRNRFDTPAHRELYLYALERVIHQTGKDAPAWAVNLLCEWGVVER